MQHFIKAIGLVAPISALLLSPVLAKTTPSQGTKPKTAAAQSQNNDIAQTLKTLCSVHTLLKDVEVFGLSFVPGAASVPAIVSALCSVLNSQLASNSKGLTAPPQNLPVKLNATVTITDPASGKTEMA